MEYTATNEEQLGHLQLGLDILGHVNQDLLPSSLYLFGLLKPESPVLATVNEAVWEDAFAGEERSENLDVKAVAVGIRLSPSILTALLGSGLTCRDSEFVYILNGEIKSSSFAYAQSKPRITASEFSKIALSNDSFPLENFMRTEGMTQDKLDPGVINKAEQAVGEHGGTEAPLHKHNPHNSSLKVYKDAADMIANWSVSTRR